MEKITLHGVTLSPFVRKVKVFLIEKKVDHNHEQAAPSQDPEFLKISPMGKIPVLVDEQGRAINDSSVIVSYLEERFPEKNLLPKDPYQRSRARWFEEYADSVIAPNLVFGIFGQKIVMPYLFGKPTDEAVVKTAMENAPKIFRYLEEQLKDKDYFVENIYSLADIAVASNLCNLNHADYHVDGTDYPELAKWFSRVTSRDYFQDLIKAEKAFIENLKAKAQAQSEN